MKWEKLGAINLPVNKAAWMVSHASVPFAEAIGGGLFRVWFSSRDELQRSHTGWVVIDINEPQKVIDLSPQPVLSPGDPGCFDDSGAMATWLVTQGDKRCLYYVGWNLGVTVPFRNSIGLAVSKGGEPFVRYAQGPIMDRTANEPHFVASCCVLPEQRLWRMWYLSCTGWDINQGRPRHHYHIKYAESNDGIQWQRAGLIAIDFKDETEYAISRPTIIHDRDCWRMWYSYRGERYRIGYAESLDGVRWTRRDAVAGIDVSATGWDSDMIEYPHVFDHAGQRYMLYNGNDFGRTGFGLAVLKEG